MLHPVIFLIFPGEFMFFNYPVHVVSHTGTPDDPVLGFSVHGLCVYIQHIMLIGHKPVLCAEHVEIFFRLVIHLLRMNINSGRKIDFRFNNVQQRIFIPFGLLTGFIRIQNVIGSGCKLFYDRYRGPETFKWF